MWLHAKLVNVLYNTLYKMNVLYNTLYEMNILYNILYEMNIFIFFDNQFSHISK